MLAAACAVLVGCASSPQRSAPGDPLEPINRQIYAFNDAFDRAIAQPVARGYKEVTPAPIDAAVTNFFSNLDDVSVLLNSGLQLKGRKAAATTFRLLFNTTFGLFGLIDVADALGVPKENEDFGQTLGYWGLGPGPYLVIPFLGPSSVRDGTGRIADDQYAPLRDITNDRTGYYSAYGLYAVDARADLLGATNVLETAAVDPYTFTREAWLRRRASLVHDGNPPPAAVPGPQDQGGDQSFDPFGNEDEDLFGKPDSGGTKPDGQDAGD